MEPESTSPAPPPTDGFPRPDGSSPVRALLRSARPRQWIKNLLLFAALVFAEKLGDPRAVGLSLIAFVCFCLLSTATYLLNDLLDRERDRTHPTKRARPIAAGILAPRTAAVAASVLAGAALLLALIPGPLFLLACLVFLALQVAYSTALKHVEIVDVLVLSSGFVVRAAAGGAAIDVRISPWLLVCTFFLALLVSLGKRRRELDILGSAAEAHRAPLGEMDGAFLDRMITIVAPVAILAYSLYTISSNQPEALVFTIPFAVYGIFRYLFLLRGRTLGEDPAEVFWRDRALQIDLALWLIAVWMILYFG